MQLDALKRTAQAPPDPAQLFSAFISAVSPLVETHGMEPGIPRPHDASVSGPGRRRRGTLLYDWFSENRTSTSRRS